MGRLLRCLVVRQLRAGHCQRSRPIGELCGLQKFSKIRDSNAQPNEQPKKWRASIPDACACSSDSVMFISANACSRSSFLPVRNRFGSPVYVYDEEGMLESAKTILEFPNAFGLTVGSAMLSQVSILIPLTLHRSVMR